MKTVRVALCAGAILTFGACGFAAFAGQRQPAPLRASELPGTYELLDRVLDNGKVLRRPDIAALYTFGNGRANFNLFVRSAAGFLSLHPDQAGRRQVDFCSAGRVSDYDLGSKRLYRGHQG